MGHAIRLVVLLLVTGSIAEDCEHERVRWRADRRRSTLEDDEPTTGRYNLPPDAALQLRAALRDVHTVDLRRRVRELAIFHRLHHSDNAESDASRAEDEDVPWEWQVTRDGGAEPDGGSQERTADGTFPLRDETTLHELLSPPRRRRDTRSDGPRGVTYNSIIRRTVVEKAHGTDRATGRERRLVKRRRVQESPADGPDDESPRRLLNRVRRDSYDYTDARQNGPSFQELVLEKLESGVRRGDQLFEKGDAPREFRLPLAASSEGLRCVPLALKCIDSTLNNLENLICEERLREKGFSGPSPEAIELFGLCIRETLAYACEQTLVLPTIWKGPNLRIIVQGWLCRFETDELAEDEDYVTADVRDKVTCIPPRVQYFYTPAKYRKKYIRNWNYRSTVCKVNFCRNRLWDNPWLGGNIPGRSEDIIVDGGGSAADGKGPYYISGDQCLTPLAAEIWNAGPRKTFPLAGFG